MHRNIGMGVLHGWAKRGCVNRCATRLNPQLTFFERFRNMSKNCSFLHDVEYRVVVVCCHRGTCMGGLDVGHEGMLPCQGASFLAFWSCVHTTVFALFSPPFQ
jgi:hypothetical protein